MNIKKYLMLGGAALTLGLATSSCVGDLDLEPIDPSQIFADVNNPEFVSRSFAECYALLGLCGNSDPGSSNLTVPDAGASVYTRLLFEMECLPSDEAFWIWEDNGLRDMCTTSFSASNKQVEIAYSRLYQHISICNDFLANTEGATNADVVLMRNEVRALRAFTYFWVCDIFGNAGFIVTAPNGETNPVQKPRAELYAWIEGELKDLVDNNLLSDDPIYGRVGKDGAEAILARLYLNAEVYTDGAVSAWDKCLTRCNNIIARHKGGGFQGSGLAQHYLYLFCRDNEQYMPGGGNKAENEILWGVPFDEDKMQSYGGTTFYLAGALSEGMYGSQASWSCLAARESLSNRFEEGDLRTQLWIRTNGIENQAFLDFSIAGYQALKWTNLTPDGMGGFSENVQSATFCSADLAMIRLADVYLMRAECYLHGQGNLTEALEGVNYLRDRAGVARFETLDEQTLLDERSRELYYEMTRRSDLIRFGRYTGNTQDVWSWKGNSRNGQRIDRRYNLMPIPTNILSAQPEMKQNPGYN